MQENRHDPQPSAHSAPATTVERIPSRPRPAVRRLTARGPVILCVALISLALVAVLLSLGYLATARSNESSHTIAMPAARCDAWSATRTESKFTAATSLSASSVWFAGTFQPPTDTLQPSLEPGFAHWDGTTLRLLTPTIEMNADQMELKGIAATSDADVWAVGYATKGGQNRLLTFHWDGKGWSLIPFPEIPYDTGHSAGGPKPTRSQLTAVTAISSSDVWVVGFYYGLDGLPCMLTAHWDGVRWQIVPNLTAKGKDTPSNTRLRAVAATSAQNVWAFGEDDAASQHPIALHWDGTAWKLSPRPPSFDYGDIAAASTDSASHIWIASGLPILGKWHFASATLEPNANTWNVNATPPVEQSALTSLDALSPQDVWAAGYKWSDYPPDANSSQIGARAFVLHWDGTQWTETSAPNPSYIQSVYAIAASSTEVWAVGTTADNEDMTPLGMVAYLTRCSSAPGNK